MSDPAQQSAARSDAEKRVIIVKTEAGDIVTYSGNPAELPGARHETRLAMKRAGVFKLLVTQNASRLPNGVIAVEHLDNIPLVTNLITDPNGGGYDFDTPCPDTPTRVARMNATRALAGNAPYTGVPNITVLPDKILKLAQPNAHEVETEALAYALTQLSVFDDRQHANELLVQCNYDGRQLGPLLDAIERRARAEDLALVTGRRNAFKEAGLNSQPLTYETFRRFFKDFNVLEYKCPANKRILDEGLLQLVGLLFIKDPSMRKSWTDHVNAPIMRDNHGVKVSGPPQSYAEAKELAEQVLRSSLVIAGIDELSSSSGGLHAQVASWSLRGAETHPFVCKCRSQTHSRERGHARRRRTADISRARPEEGRRRQRVAVFNYRPKRRRWKVSLLGPADDALRLRHA